MPTTNTGESEYRPVSFNSLFSISVPLGLQRLPEGLPRFWSFTLELCDGLHEGLFGVAELDHAAEVSFAAEEEGMDEFARGGEGAFLIYERGEGTGDGGECVGVHHCWSGRRRCLSRHISARKNGDQQIYTDLSSPPQ